MRNTKTCPKCRSHDVVVVPGGVGGPYAGDNVHVGFLRSPVGVTHCMCYACGFLEDWVEDAEERARIKEKYGDGER
jgi:hypothetical protein